MDIVSLRTFLAAAETGSFAAAAQRVHASPSSVTERIKQLEHLLGARLFERDKRGCQLTAAGRRFMSSAGQAVRAMDIARQEVALPERFTRSVAIGGQYTLWGDRLLNWLSILREDMPDLAVRATAGTSARLNRDLAEGFLDFALLYDPVFGRDIAAEPLFKDELILVTAGDPAAWQEDFVRIEWGRSVSEEIAARLHLAPDSGLVLDLGARSAQWLIEHRMAGYMPRLSVVAQIAAGELVEVTEAPAFDFPAWMCWRRDLASDLADALADGLRKAGLNH